MKFRPTQPRDLEETYLVRASTRQNPISREKLVAAGWTPEFVSEKLVIGEYIGWVCEQQGKIIGFTTGNTRTGEIIVLAVLPEYEGMKIGKRLLSRLMDTLTGKGCTSLWLEASPDPKVRAHGFYRANGWAPTGRTSANGDEVLEPWMNGILPSAHESPSNPILKHV